MFFLRKCIANYVDIQVISNTFNYMLIKKGETWKQYLNLLNMSFTLR